MEAFIKNFRKRKFCNIKYVVAVAAAVSDGDVDVSDGFSLPMRASTM